MLRQCLEARFDTWAAFGQDIDPTMVRGGGPAIGGRLANLSDKLRPYAQELAQNETGHVR